MKTNDLIKDLAKDVSKVKPIDPPFKRIRNWIGIAVIYLTIFLGLFGFRDDLGVKINEGLYVLELSLAFLTSVIAAYCSCCLSVPDAYQKKWVLWGPYIPFVMLLAFFAVSYVEPSIYDGSVIKETDNSFLCAVDIFMFSALPVIVLFVSIKRAATTKSLLSGLFIGLAAANFSYFFLRMIEANDVVSHLLVWHYFPMTLVAFISAFLGQKLLKW